MLGITTHLPITKIFDMKSKNVWSIIAIVVMIAICVALCLHWGFFGVICSTIVYGLWANYTEDKEKRNERV